MLRCLLMILLIAQFAMSKIVGEKQVKNLVRTWAPLVWLAPGERFLPISVPEFLDNMQSHDASYLHTRVDVEILLQNQSSFLYGRRPSGDVPIYALVKNCEMAELDKRNFPRKKIRTPSKKRRNEEFVQSSVQTNDILDDEDYDAEEDKEGYNSKEQEQGREEYGKSSMPHFHVTYWMFYAFSEGKSVCVLNLGLLGSWPIPMVGGRCLGVYKEYGSHVGDWEHVSLYFKGDEHPLAMYVSAHDAGAFYRYDVLSRTFVYESQETRKGIFQKPTFPERVFTSGGSHPVLFSAKGSHGLWTAPGKHKFVRIPRLYDESGFGTPWQTWRRVELLLQEEDDDSLPLWMSYMGKWGNPKSHCHPLARLGFDICQFVDGPTGIPLKRLNFQCLVNEQ